MELSKKIFIIILISLAAICLNSKNIKNNVTNNIKKEIKEETIIKNYLPKKVVKASRELAEKKYYGLTRTQIIDKSGRMLNSNLSGTEQYFVDYSIERGVDPLLSIAIVLQETGCYWNCSALVINQNNVGGMRGANGYLSFPTMNQGIKAYIDNLANNYVAYGLTTSQTMNHKYAEDPLWSARVNAYIERILSA